MGRGDFFFFLASVQNSLTPPLRQNQLKRAFVSSLDVAIINLGKKRFFFFGEGGSLINFTQKTDHINLQAPCLTNFFGKWCHLENSVISLSHWAFPIPPTVIIFFFFSDRISTNVIMQWKNFNEVDEQEARQ